MFQFIHTADIHLDSPLRGLEKYDGAPIEQIRTATRRSFERLIDLALHEGVAFVLIAGDLWDGDWQDAGPGLFFIKQARRLREAGIPVYVIKGNHDAASTLTRELKFPDNVKMFHHARPETAVLEDLGVAIHGQSYATSSVSENLAAGYPRPIEHAFNIGLLHTCLDGDARHYPYAPVPIEALASSGYQYWALGHIHQARKIVRDGVHIVFPGNPQGRGIGELGAKGCEVVDVDGNGRVSSRFEALDVVRWLDEPLDISRARKFADIEESFTGFLDRVKAENPGPLLALRMRLRGTTPLHGDLLDRETVREKLQAIAADVDGVWLERTIVETHAPEDSVDASEISAELRDLVREIAADDDLMRRWMGEFDGLREKLSGELDKLEIAAVLREEESFRRYVVRGAENCLAIPGEPS